MIRLVLFGCTSMIGVVGASAALIGYFDPAGTNALDPLAMIACVMVAAVAWCFALHWTAQRKQALTSARVIRRRDRASRVTT